MTTRTHFAGLNSKPFAEALEGFPVLISNADIVRRPGVWKDAILPRLEAGDYVLPILDSGAFTELSERARSAKKLAAKIGIEVADFTPGHWAIAEADAFETFHVSVEDYAALINEHGHHFDQIINLDDIQGDLARSWTNQQRLEELTGREIIPVFHGREDFAVLEMYCKRSKRVGLGFARIPSGSRVVIAPDQGDGLDPNAWLAKALDIIEAAGCEVHGFGMTRFAMKLGHTRLTTSDSTTWVNEYCATRPPTPGKRAWVTGEARQLLKGMCDLELMFFVLMSYRATGLGDPHQIEGATGQAGTAFNRYSAHELRFAVSVTRSRFENRYSEAA